MRKVELSVMKPWIAKKVIDLLGFEDEVVIEYVSGLLEDPNEPVVDGKKMYISLLGFLEKKTEPFMVELWDLLLSAQASPVKVPAIFIEQKKAEMAQRQSETKKNSEIALVRQSNEDAKSRKVDEIRERERGDRRERSGFRDSNDSGRRDRGGRDFRDNRDDRPPRRDDRDRPRERDGDKYDGRDRYDGRRDNQRRERVRFLPP